LFQAIGALLNPPLVNATRPLLLQLDLDTHPIGRDWLELRPVILIAFAAITTGGLDFDPLVVLAIEQLP
jgi:hypothetical protein